MLLRLLLIVPYLLRFVVLRIVRRGVSVSFDWGAARVARVRGVFAGFGVDYVELVGYEHGLWCVSVFAGGVGVW